MQYGSILYSDNNTRGNEGKMEEVYIVFEERQLSCDRDYGEDGYMIVWDLNELGRNLTIEKLAKRIREQDEELHTKLIKHMEEELQLYDFGLADDYLTEIMEFLTNETEGIMYLFYYQNVSTIHSVYATEEMAKKSIEYYTRNIAYKNKYHCTKFKIIQQR